jgi:short-subunit dehydrogenase
MTVLRQLTAAAEIDEYAAAYAEASGYRVPIEYLRRSLVFGFVRGGRLLGGVVMSGQAPFRTLDRIPDGYREAVSAAVDAADTIELVCVWLHPTLRGSVLSALFWFGLFLETGRRGVRSVLFGTESRRLYAMYLLGRPRVLYSGPVTVDGVQRHGWIFHSPVAHRWSALRRMVLYKLTRRRRARVAEAAPDAAPTLDVSRPPETRFGAGQAKSAVAVPLRSLATAARELGAGLFARFSRMGARQAEVALAASALEDGWALVTGASAGIGLAFAERLAQRGAGLLLVADDAEIVAVAERLRRDCGVRADALVADLATERGIADALAWVGERRVEVLVNNAGVGVKGAFVGADPAEYVRMIGVNLLAPVLLTRTFLPGMVARGRGAVIHVASVNALAPIPRSAVYSATKTFLLAYATAVWHETRSRGVVLQTLLPGTTATSFHEKQRTKLPAWAYTPARVADSSLAALGRGPVHVPGALNKAFRILGGLLPLTARTAAAGAALTASLGAGATQEAGDRSELAA